MSVDKDLVNKLTEAIAVTQQALDDCHKEAERIRASISEAEELRKQLEACEEEAKKPRPAPAPRAVVTERGIPLGHASAGMPPDPCADLRARYEKARRALPVIPDCSALEQEVEKLSRELERARHGEPPSEGFKLPADDPTKPPWHLSPDSKKLHSQIMKLTTVNGQLPYWVLESETGLSTSAMVKAEIYAMVTNFLKDNGTKLNGPERSYWERVQAASKGP